MRPNLISSAIAGLLTASAAAAQTAGQLHGHSPAKAEMGPVGHKHRLGTGKAATRQVPRPGAKSPCPECGSRKVEKAISRPAPAAVKGDGEICAPSDCARGP